MSTIYDYAWYLSGRKLAILQRGASTTYSADSINTYNMYLTPTVDDTDAIAIEYVYTITEPTAESDTIDVSKMLSLALVDYVRFRIYEDEGKEKLADKYYGKFLAKVSVEADNRTGMPRKIIPTGTAVLR